MTRRESVLEVLTRRGTSFFGVAPEPAKNPKVVERRALNLIGLQLGRSALAHALHRSRLARSHASAAPLVRELHERGIVLVENFLPRQEFERVRDEQRAAFEGFPEASLGFHARSPFYEMLADPAGQHVRILSGDVIDDFVRVPVEGRGDGFDAIRGSVLKSERLLELVAGAAGIERVEPHPAELHRVYPSGDSARGADPQSALHQDTYCPDFKAWLTLGPTDEASGAFVFAPGSNAPSLRRLLFEYWSSIRARDGGSWRLPDTARSVLGVRRSVFGCPENTLIVANTYGFHARSAMAAHAVRDSIYISFRMNPWRLTGRGVLRP